MPSKLSRVDLKARQGTPSSSFWSIAEIVPLDPSSAFSHSVPGAGFCVSAVRIAGPLGSVTDGADVDPVVNTESTPLPRIPCIPDPQPCRHVARTATAIDLRRQASAGRGWQWVFVSGRFNGALLSKVENSEQDNV